MNQDLHDTIIMFYNSADYQKINRRNYESCYRAFEDYCNKIYGNCSVKKLFEDNIIITSITNSCVEYYNSSKRARSLAAVERYLIAIDNFYQWLRGMGVKCEKLEDRCNKKYLKEQICNRIGIPIEHEEYMPISDETVEKIEKMVEQLKPNKFYPYGQKLIFELLIKYGFKTQIILGISKDAYNPVDRTLVITNKVYGNIILELPDKFVNMFNRYNELQIYKDREYMFTYTDGKQLETNDIFDTLQDKIRASEIGKVSAINISLKGVENMINRGLFVSEIQRITGFSAKKIIEVYERMHVEKDINKIINEKLR